MSALHLCILLLSLLSTSLGAVPPPERSYKILMLLPVSSKSHRNLFMPLAEALADRGHKIVMLTNNNKLSEHPNIEEIFHGLKDFQVDDMNMFENRKQSGRFPLFRRALPAMAEKLYRVPEVQRVYAARKDFDLIVIDHGFNEMTYPFAQDKIFITIATPGLDYRQSAVLGNPITPAVYQGTVGSIDLDCVFGRLLNTLSHIWFAFYWRNWGILPFVQKEVDVHFPGLPRLLDIEKNQSLSLVNTHFSMGLVAPLLPSQVEIGAIHCQPANPLPEDLKSWIDGAGKAGVVYFSLGSVARGETMPAEYKQLFIEAFKKMDQRILWKYETKLEGISNNVKISNWLPQQDILAHPNVKVFITHSGLLSTQEASYHGTPLLALPIFGDQPKNAGNIVSQGLGLSLVWEELTVDKIVDSLNEIINNPKYTARAQEVSTLSKDQLESPLDRAVFWTEYVIRHNGAPQLRSPAADLSWIQFLLLDTVAILIAVLIVVLLIARWILWKLLSMVFGKSKKRKYD